MQGFPSILKEINPDAARLAELVKKPGRRAPAELCATTSPASFRGAKVPTAAKLWWPGLAQALDGAAQESSERLQTTAPVPGGSPREAFWPQAPASDEDSSDDELLIRLPPATDFRSTMPRRAAKSQGARANPRGRRLSSVPSLPQWLQRQIRRAEAPKALTRAGTSTVSLASATSDAANKTPSDALPKVKAKSQGTSGGNPPGAAKGRRRRPSVRQVAPSKEEEPRSRREGRQSLSKDTPGAFHAETMRRQTWDEAFTSSRTPTRKERCASEADVKILEDVSQPLGHSDSGSIFRGGRLVNAEKKRNVAFKGIVLKSNRRLRVKRINYLRKVRYKGHEDEDEIDSDAEQDRCRVRPPPKEADTPEGANLLEAFRRYDTEETGELSVRDAKACFSDLGIQPTLPQDKQAAATVLQNSLRRPEGGLDFYDIEKLMPKMWEAIAHAKRKDLEYSHTRALDENGDYDLQQLRPCLEALGVWIYSTEEWSEVEKIFTARQGDRPPVRKPTAPKSPARVLSKLWSGPDLTPTPRKESVKPVQLSRHADYEKFEQSFFEAQKHLTVRRRRLERELCEEHHLTQEQVEDFRADLVGLDFLFRKHNRYGNRYLNENEVLELLVACGADARLLCTELVPSLIREGRHLANQAKRVQHMPEPHVQFAKTETATLGAGWRKVQKRARPRIRRSFRQYEIVSLSEEEVDFFDFLYLMKFVRQKSREIQTEKLRNLFLKLDKDERGNVAIKDVMRLFRDLNLSPRSRQEQLEIKQVLNEVDEDGTGTLSWFKFTYVVQLCQERLERLVRIDEERYAMALGFSEDRFRELRKVFLDHKNEACVLQIKELRSVMNALQRPYSSEELLRLFQAFSASEGHFDLRCLIRLLCAIEIQRTEGQLPQDRLKGSPRRSEAERQATELLMMSPG